MGAYLRALEKNVVNLAINNLSKGNFGVIGFIGKVELFEFIKPLFREETAIGYVQKLAREEKPDFQVYAVYNSKGEQLYREESKYGNKRVR